MNKIELTELLTHWSQSYYDGTPEVDDSTFDYHLELLKKIDPSNQIITKTAHGYSPTSVHLQKCEHTFVCGSLEKIKETDSSIWTNESFIVTPKFDGGSVVAYYKKGKIDKILSRGNGHIGLDITRNVIHCVPEIIQDHTITAVRGELLISYEYAKKTGASHPRNKAVGLSQSINSTQEELNELKIVFYDLPEYSGSPFDILIKLNTNGFIIPSFKLFSDWSEFKEFAAQHNKTEIKISEFDGIYPIDGLVLSLSNNKKSVAYKFTNEIAESKVLDIAWQLSRTGRYVPVLLVKPTELSGANISRVTANNYEWLINSGAGVGSIIDIIRSNEIIPTLVGVKYSTDNFNVPSVCEICGESLTRVNKDLMCQNAQCDGKTRATISRILSYYAPDGIGSTIVDKVIDLFELNTINDLKIWVNEITNEELNEYFGIVTAKNVTFIANAIKNHKSTISDILLVANIPSISNSTIERMANEITSEEFISAIKGNKELIRSEKWMKCYPSYLQPKNLELLLGRLFEICELFDWSIDDKQKMETKTIQLKFALTGALSKSRNEIVKEFNERGYKLVDVKIADVLIAPGISNSAKYKLAVNRGIPIMNEIEFRTIYIK
jgi:DNA ligase (NAD+)